ncbi:MAG: Glu-tRNA(Gln) amidotransferase subunit GatE [Bacteroidales bacterium]|nr:Glu-tRNA(Gln) amidotransferase subunit GatE [Bacteroidales bacterium]
MSTIFDPRKNYEQTRKKAGYVERKQAKQADYDRIGFMSGLEVHQQIKTKEKLFCHCPAGRFNKFDDYDAELIRHMRPTLSELGEYDGTALMEFKTRKEIVYRIKNGTACTYDIDDTPPFPINKEALHNAIVIALRSNLNIVGEVHITRKQYLDGSIPTGFQRTAIVGVEGLLKLPKKDIRLIQLSIEEDACREISDVGHRRVYQTDRLGVPLIETVTYPDCKNPEELKETCEYIRFLGRSTGLVRTGMGAGRQDVNVSCKGGTRIELKGVQHAKWIPELSHNECFRQWSLVQLQKRLNKEVKKEGWKVTVAEVRPSYIKLPTFDGQQPKAVRIVKLPNFRGVLSTFTQPGKMFADEIADRLKVIACLERPNMLHDEMFEPVLTHAQWHRLGKKVHATADDALILVWGPEDDMPTAIETIEERCLMAFDGVPKETRKAISNGITIFERVLPGADRMYPDTDSAPIPLNPKDIAKMKKELPTEIIDRYYKLKEWNVPEDCFTYIFTKNWFPTMDEIVTKLGVDGRMLGCFVAMRLKNLLGKNPESQFGYETLYKLFAFLKKEKLNYRLAWNMAPTLVEDASLDMKEVLRKIGFRRASEDTITKKLNKLMAGYKPNKKANAAANKRDWIMGQMHEAMGNIELKVLANNIK